jgi:hypothetical protein
MAVAPTFSLADFVLAVYCALDDALQGAGIYAENGKLIRRRGGAPDVDDREILCLAVVQELLHFESDNAFYNWLTVNPVMTSAFPRLLSRPNFADRRAILAPLIEKLCGALCAKNGEADPPFSSSIPIRSTSAERPGPERKSGSAAWQKTATAKRCAMASTACASI